MAENQNRLEVVRMQVVSKLKTQLDGNMNDVIGQAKMLLNNSVEVFLNSLWAGLVQEIKTAVKPQIIAEYEAEKAKKAKPEEKKPEETKDTKGGEDGKGPKK